LASQKATSRETLAVIIPRNCKKTLLKKLKKYTVLILAAFICNFLLSKFTDNFRFNPEFRWIYSYGKPTTLLIFFALIGLSIANGILIIKENKVALKTRLLWTILSLSFFIYFSTMMLIAIFKD